MRILRAVILAAAISSSGVPAASAADKPVEPQVVHCGIKDGQPKEYGTKSAAEADGATDIVIKTGDKCPAVK